MRVRAVSAVLALVLAAGCREAPVYDTVLVGGAVVDSTGAPAFIADVAINDGRIADRGPGVGTLGAETVDVAGLTVAPGFWDNHAHLVTLEEHHWLLPRSTRSRVLRHPRGRWPRRSLRRASDTTRS